jgi:hypothetical protein
VLVLMTRWLSYANGYLSMYVITSVNPCSQDQIR